MRGILIALVILTFGFVGIVSFHPKEDAIENPPVLPDIESRFLENQNKAICIWQPAGLREQPGRRFKYLASVQFGEQVDLLEEERVEKGNRTYIRVKLSDDTEGWVHEYLFAENAFLAVVNKVEAIYRRPDLMTFRDKELEPGEIVAVLSIDNGWAQVVGEARKKIGWIRNVSSLSMEGNDLEFARKYRLALQEKETYKQYKAFQDLLADEVLQQSPLISIAEKTYQEFGLKNHLPENQLYIIEPNVALRSEPNRNEGEMLYALNEGVICDVLQRGPKVSYEDVDDFWYEVQYEGESGWVYGLYTSKKLTE